MNTDMFKIQSGFNNINDKLLYVVYKGNEVSNGGILDQLTGLTGLIKDNNNMKVSTCVAEAYDNKDAAINMAHKLNASINEEDVKYKVTAYPSDDLYEIIKNIDNIGVIYSDDDGFRIKELVINPDEQELRDKTSKYNEDEYEYYSNIASLQSDPRFLDKIKHYECQIVDYISDNKNLS